MAIWNFLVHALFPVPTILLVVLSLPLPQFAKSFVRKVTLKITNVIFYKFPIGGAGHVSIFHLAMGLSSILLFLTSSELAAKAKHHDHKSSFHDVNCQRWREERNFWISVLAFTMWLVLSRFIAITREAEMYKAEIKKSEKIQ